MYALPGAPAFSGSLNDVIDRAVQDATTLAEGGVDALLVENFHDYPFYPMTVEPETVAAAAVVPPQSKQRRERVANPRRGRLGGVRGDDQLEPIGGPALEHEVVHEIRSRERHGPCRIEAVAARVARQQALAVEQCSIEGVHVLHRREHPAVAPQIPVWTVRGVWFEQDVPPILSALVAVRDAIGIEPRKQKSRVLEAQWNEDVGAHVLVVALPGDTLDHRGEQREPRVGIDLARARLRAQRRGERAREQLIARQRLEVAAETERKPSAVIDELLQRDAWLVGRSVGKELAQAVLQCERAASLESQQRDEREVLRVGADLDDGRVGERNAPAAIGQPVALPKQ